MIKAVNLKDLIKLSDDKALSKRYVRYVCDTPIKKQYKHREIVDIQALCQRLNITDADADNFYYGYEVPHLSKEFDLLKISAEMCLNIELKSENPGLDKIREQLQSNKHFLKLLDKSLLLYTFVSSSAAVYSLTENDELTCSDIDSLKSALTAVSNEKREFVDLDEIFSPSKILVSPLNNPQDFYDGKYLLTTHQNNIKKKIIAAVNASRESRFIALSGEFGTGKTLLLYDIAKSIANRARILIVHSGMLCPGHSLLNQLFAGKIDIICAKDLDECNLSYYAYIFVDETQRLYVEQFDKIKRWAQENRGTCVFTYDYNQTLSKKELVRMLPDAVEKLCEPYFYKLTNNIRTNEEIAEFIQCLFDISKKRKKQSFTRVKILYEPDQNKAHLLAKKLEKDEGYLYITYTPSQLHPELNYQAREMNTHRVIGQEFDKVAMILNEYFYYKGDKLCAKRHPNPDYLFYRLLYQGLSRARSHLILIVTLPEQLRKILTLFETIES